MPDSLGTGALAFIDALGFKGIWDRYDPDGLVGKFREAQDEARAVVAGLSQPIGGAILSPKVLFLSDTIVFASHAAVDRSTFKGDVPKDAEQLLAVVTVTTLTATLLGKLALGPMPLAYRGAVSVGRCLIDSDLGLLLGPAVDEAATCEKMAQAAIVWFAPSAQELVEWAFAAAADPKSDTERLVKRLLADLPIIRGYPVPLKGGPVRNACVVNPLGARRGDPNAPTLIFRPERVRAGLQATFASGADREDVNIKAQHTSAFLDAASREIAHVPGPK